MFDRANAEARSTLYRKIRDFFDQRGVLEVDVPVLGCGGSVDPHMHSMLVGHMDKNIYLQTSPEFFLKRLLCDGSGDVYTICKAFRSGEHGRFHNPEFSLLEWYRLGFSLEDLIREVLDLLVVLGVSCQVSRLSYAEQFQSVTGLDPHSAGYAELHTLAAKSGLRGDLDHKGLLEFLMATLVEPQLPSGLVVISDYPSYQAELAKVQEDESGNQVARRFEIYLDRVELANGYDELTDAVEQRKRFEIGRSQRKAMGSPEIKFDQKFMEAVENGLPDCSGVAVGLDRLLMLLLNQKSLADGLSFSWDQL